MWNHYQKTTTHQTKLIDIFLLFLVVVGAIQFLYYLVLARDVSGNQQIQRKAETNTSSFLLDDNMTGLTD